MAKTILSVQVDDIESVIRWYTSIHDAILVSRGETTATFEFHNKIVNYVEYGEESEDSVWTEIILAVDEIDEESEKVIYSSDMSVEDFFTKGIDDE
jgi:hypothetical protein